MIWLIAIVALASIALNSAAILQTECSQVEPTLEDFLSLADGRAVEFVYFNPSTEDISSYISSEFGVDSPFAFFMIDGRYVLLIGKKIEPPLAVEEEYRGVKLKILDDVCWAEFNGITIYGRVENVKRTIDSYYREETMYEYLVSEGFYESLNGSDYVRILKGNYCPFCSDFKIVKAKAVGDKYVVKIFSKGMWQSSVLDSFLEVKMFEKHRKKTIVIDVQGIEVTGIRAV
ncbi:hypothetical protein [Archaeoglobus veneficus]|uniref:Uncharacterized protein n=1 Tax=Archaeoglobus veneficus (strain DSM 11195 / SNP6) TaxID=693661 RepID=F2KS55_ARCVS|nr:hypothetical protein [Archaeoglobus veneficus]AEA47994.1 hypothetical protein Arcve_2001 [Archaeoglobus veneficus SNP6]